MKGWLPASTAEDLHYAFLSLFWSLDSGSAAYRRSNCRAKWGHPPKLRDRSVHHEPSKTSPKQYAFLVGRKICCHVLVEEIEDNMPGSDQDGPPLLRQAAARARHIAKYDVPEKIRTKVSLAILDYYCAIACGLQSPWAQSLRKYAERRRGSPEAWSWLLKDKVSVETAALTNAALAHRLVQFKAGE